MLTDHDLDLLFRDARTHRHWLKQPVSDVMLEAAYDLARMGPTAANCQPMRVAFVTSAEAKERLKPCLDAGNVDAVMAAPVTAIVGYDLEYYEHLPVLFPHVDLRSKLIGKTDAILENAFRNGSLQAAYLLIACRALGLDCGPMSGFDRAKVDAAFFASTAVKSNLLINIGHAEKDKAYPRGPRLSFADACRIL